MSTDLLEDKKTAPAEPGDHEKFSHYVRREDILRSQVDGVPAKALCGKEWHPTSDPEKFPVCPECKDIYEALRDE
jgi:hypothetical protein